MDFQILGQLAVIDGPRRIGLSRPLVRQLVTTLAAFGGWLDSRDLVALIWEDTARKRPVLYQTVLNARKAFDEHAERIKGARDLGFHLCVEEGDRVDLWEFQRRSKAGMQAFRRGDPRGAVDELGAGLELVPLHRQLADFPETPEMRSRLTSALRTEIAAVQEAWIGGRMMLREYREVQPVLESLVGGQPLTERWWAMLMHAQYLSGGAAPALAVFRRALDAFAAEEMELEGEVLAMRARIDAGDADLLLPLPLAERAGSGPRLVPRQLPADPPDFAGRLSEVEELTAMLAHPGGGGPVRVAICGEPGVGKSALAVHVGHLVRDHYPDGQLYLSLDGAGVRPREPADVLAEILRTLGVCNALMPATLDERTNLFRTVLARRRVLIVLDDAAGPEQVAPLFPGAPGCAVVITANDQLAGLTGAHLTHLRPLASVEAMDLLRMIIGARRVDADPPGAAAVVAACEGSPLAVRIAAARLVTRRTWSLTAFAALLTDHHRLDHLTAGDMDVRSRIEPSYRGLAVFDARVLRTASLLGTAEFGAWPLALALDQDCSEALIRLVDRGLLTDRGLDPLWQPRYQLPGLVADFCRERHHGDPDVGEMVDRLVAGARGLVDRAMMQLPGSGLSSRPGSRGVVLTAGGGVREDIDRDPARWLDTECAVLQAIVEAARDTGRGAGAGDLVDGLAACLRLSTRAGDVVDDLVAAVSGRASSREDPGGRVGWHTTAAS